MPRTEKDLMIGDLKGFLRTDTAMFIAEYSGINANELNGLRRSLQKEGGGCRIVKNSVSKIAFSSHPWDEFLDYISGPTMFVFAGSNPLETAKTISRFADQHKGFNLKAGFMDNSFVDGERIFEIAKLPTREVLIGKFVCGLAASMTNLVRVMNFPLGAFVNLISAISKKTGGSNDDRKGN